MRKSLLASAVVAGLGIASASQAAIVVSYINRGTPVGTGGAPVANGYTGWTVRLTETTGANITAIDASSGNNGLFGRFVQRWSDAQGDGVYGNESGENSVTANQENLTNSIGNFDSHILPPGTPHNAANFVGIIDPAESVGSGTFVPPPGGTPPFPNNDASFGIAVSGENGFIKMSYGINGPVQSSVYDMAYLVIPNGEESGGSRGNFGSSLIATAGAAPQLVIFPPIPEPATMGLAGLSALGFLARRRRA
jgi:hypothetical protein